MNQRLKTTVTRTPADQKWLLNEIARIKGEQAKLDVQRGALKERLEHIDALRKEQTRMLQALKATLHLVANGQSISLDRVVKAHRFIGGRGALCDWLKDHLQHISPTAVAAQVLMDRFCDDIRMRFFTESEREAYFNNTFRSQLHRLKRQGYVEQVDVYVEGRYRSHWRWKAQAPSFEELQQQAAAMTEAQEAAWP